MSSQQHKTNLAKLSLSELIHRIACKKPANKDTLLFYAREYRADFQRALHKALRQPEDHDPTPSFRRVRPGISGDELSDFTLFCGQLFDEGNRPTPRPGKRIKALLTDDVWEIIESAAQTEWEARVNHARYITAQYPQLRDVWIVLDSPDLFELPQPNLLPDPVWEAIGEYVDGGSQIRPLIEASWSDICKKLSTEYAEKTWRNRVCEALSALLKSPDLYEEDSFRSVPKNDEVKELLDKEVDGREPGDVVRLNRLLLEAVFPRFLARSAERQPSYWQIDDEVFFTLIEDDAYWLTDPVIFQQIKCWQSLMETGGSKLRSALHAKFKRIGDALKSVKGSGNWGSHGAIYKRYELYKEYAKDLGKQYDALPGDNMNRTVRLGRLLDQLIQEEPDLYLRAYSNKQNSEGVLTAAERKRAVEHLQRWVPYTNNPPSQIACTIVAQEADLSEQTIRNIIKSENRNKIDKNRSNIKKLKK